MGRLKFQRRQVNSVAIANTMHSLVISASSCDFFKNGNTVDQFKYQQCFKLVSNDLHEYNIHTAPSF